jgi:Rha family phage regulatory protein
MKLIASQKEVQIVEKVNRLWVSSVDLADHFGKEHKNVLRKIQSLGCSKKFTQLNFAPSEYKDSTGRTLPSYDITRDGFTILIMGFTGRAAMAWKEKYIAAFNAMERALKSGQAYLPPPEDEGEDLFYIMSLNADKKSPFVTWWKPDDRGYTHYLNQAGKYTAEQIESAQSYYNNRKYDVPIPCDAAEDVGEVIVPRDGNLVMKLLNISDRRWR